MQKGTDRQGRSTLLSNTRGGNHLGVGVYERVLPVVAALLLAMPVFGQEAGRTAVIWHDRGEVAALDVVSGAGGKDHEPGTDFRFIEESQSGTSAKFVVEDEHGTTWKVKLGQEAKSETAATRLLWAAGYVVDEDYYRPHIRVVGLKRLARGQEFVSHGDIVTGVRLERAGRREESNTWSWYDNPFIGTREFNGLRVMMGLINNWDLKAIPVYRKGHAHVRRFRHAQPAFLPFVFRVAQLPLPDADGKRRQAHSDRRRPLDGRTAWTIVIRADQRLFPRRRVLAGRG